MADPDSTTYEQEHGRKPPERVPKSERILNLIAVLLRADKPVPVTEILGKVTGYDDDATRESLMRRFERDKKVLRDIGIPVEHVTQGSFGQDGYSISRTDYFLDELHLPPESGQILRLLYAWAHADGGELSNDLRSALVKVGFLVDGDEGAPPVEPTEALEPASPDTLRFDPKLVNGPIVGRNLEVLSEAVLRRRRVRFRYYTIGRDEESEVEVDPYGLGFSGQAWNRGAWYLVGYSHLREDLRVFKVQRIRNEAAFVHPEGDGPEFTIPLGFRVRGHLGRTRWEYQDLTAAFDQETGLAPGDAPEKNGGQARPPVPITCRVGFEQAVAAEVRALVPSATVTGRDLTHEYLEMTVQQKRPFLRFLLRYVPRIKIVSPAGLDAELRALAREVLTRYRGGAS